MKVDGDASDLYTYVHSSVPMKGDAIKINGVAWMVAERAWGLTSDDDYRECYIGVVTLELWAKVKNL